MIMDESNLIIFDVNEKNKKKDLGGNEKIVFATYPTEPIR